MAWGSTVPAALAGLAAALQTIDAAVIDGAAVSDAGLKEVVNVGWQTEDTPSVEGGEDPATTDADRETYRINCRIRVQRGRDMSGARTRAFVLLGEVGSALKANRTLGDAVMRAWIGEWSLDLQPSPRGAVVEILFAVACDAYTTT